MSHLVPEQRVNKNGHLVTKYVLPGTAGPQTKAAIPPVPPPSTDPGTEPVETAASAEATAEALAAARREGEKEALSVFIDAARQAASLDDMEHLAVWADEGDLEALRVFSVHGSERPFSNLQDILYKVAHKYDGGKIVGTESFRAHLALDGSGHLDYWDADDRLSEAVIDLVHERPHEVEAVATFLSERNGDPEGLEEYLAEQNALRSGVL